MMSITLKMECKKNKKKSFNKDIFKSKLQDKYCKSKYTMNIFIRNPCSTAQSTISNIAGGRHGNRRTAQVRTNKL